MTNSEHVEVLRKELSEAMGLPLKIESIQMHPDEAQILGLVPGKVYQQPDGKEYRVHLITKDERESP